MTTQSAIADTDGVSKITNDAIEEVLGPDAFLNLVDPDATEFPPSLDISNINQKLVDAYGDNGGYGIALRIGRTIFSRLLRGHEALANLGELSFRVLPLAHKIERGLPVVINALENTLGEEGHLQDTGTEIHYIVQECPDCQASKPANRPICYVTLGILKEAMYWLSGCREFQIQETECMAMGDTCCRFVIHKTPRLVEKT